jgi:acyl-CoA hydrolase/GNAT superfamily N-acetyltransferase
MLAATERWRERLRTSAEALALVRPGDRVFVGTGCAAPLTLLRALEQSTRLPGVRLVHVVLSGELPDGYDEGLSSFRHEVLFIGTGDRALIRAGRADYVPVSLADIPAMIRDGRFPIDVALVQVTPPDSSGMCSLGISIDVTKAAVEAADRVIAEVNPVLPRTHGDGSVPLERLDCLVEVAPRASEYLHEPIGDAGRQIARYVARIIPDGATLQIGVGRVANEMLRYLRNRRDLGIHSDVITEPLVDLIQEGVVTGARKSVDPRLVVASWAMGTRRLYDLLDDNPRFALRPVDQVCDAVAIAAQDRMVSVTQAFAIDLTGQVSADEFAGELYGGVGTQADFHRGASRARGGKAIVCLASTTEEGDSRILPHLRDQDGVTIARADVHYVVTEFGTAYLFGRSLHDRAVALIEIAHPDHREELLAAAKRLGYVHPKQELRSRSAYPTQEERHVTLRDGRSVLIRPTRTTDASGLQQLFYGLTARDVYTRFFTNLTSLTDEWAEHLCSVNYEQEMAFVAVTGEDWEHEQLIASSAYYVDPSTNLADVAYIVHPQWQGAGLGSALQARTIEYARDQGLRGFTADVLIENKAMLRVFERSGLYLSKRPQRGVCELEMLFRDSGEN